MQLRKLKSIGLLGATAAVAMASGIPMAQAQVTDDGLLEEVTVTARKRDEKLLNIPLTLTVLTAESIASRDIKQLNDVVDFSPGLFYGGPTAGRNDRSNRRLLIRGMQVNTDAQTRQATTVFIDGAPILGSEIGSTEDAERIEIVKGPQSAYFGRATFAGAINVITKQPGENWQAKLSANVASFNTRDFNLVGEGPLVKDKLSARLSVGRYDTDGQYTNANNGQKLGERSTQSGSLTLYATPIDGLKAKLRIHAWNDDDGPSATVGFGLNNGADVFNCNLGGNGGPVNGTNNYICGTLRQWNPSEIQSDTTLTPAIAALLTSSGVDINHFGLKRDAREYSLGLSYESANGYSVDSISASHRDYYRVLDDIDRRATASLGLIRDTVSMGNTRLKDFSQELRLTSPAAQRFRWMIGASYFDIKSDTSGGGIRSNGVFAANALATNTVRTGGLFGSINYDFTKQLTLSVEARKQDDKVTDCSGTVCLSGTFKSFLPRVIVDYKPSQDLTFYASYSKGTRPGEFNSNLVGLPQSVLDQVAASIGADISIDEETLANNEIGFKGKLWDGKAALTVALYQAKWRKQHNRGIVQATFPDNSQRLITTTGTGGKTDLEGLEAELVAAVTRNLTLEATYALNHSEILVRDCADCLGVLGFREIAGLRKEFSRTPVSSATASATWHQPFHEQLSWFVRGDYIYRGSMWATEANVLQTGTTVRINLRAGVDFPHAIVEAYVTNLADDKTYSGFQRFSDLAFGGNRALLTAGLPDRRTFGVRASYTFGR